MQLLEKAVVKHVEEETVELVAKKDEIVVVGEHDKNNNYDL